MHHAPEAPTQLALPRPQRRTATPRALLQPVARLSKAHLALARGSGLTVTAEAVQEKMRAALSGALGTQVHFASRVLGQVLNASQHLPGRGLALALDLGSVGGLGVLCVDGPLCGALLARAAGSPAGCRVPAVLSKVEEAALAWLALVLLEVARADERLDAALGARLLDIFPRIDLARFLLAEQGPLLAVEIKVTLEDTGGVATLLLPARCVAMAHARFPPPAPRPLPHAIAEASVRGALRCGGVTLQARETAQLSVGDVLTFPELHPTAAGVTGPARLVLPLATLSGQLTDSTFTLTAVTPRSLPPELRMPATDTVLSCEVEIELGRVPVPVGELATLRPGGILALHLSHSPEVTLRLGDRAFARAELVDIEGVLGARIVSLVGSAP